MELWPRVPLFLILLLLVCVNGMSWSPLPSSYSRSELPREESQLQSQRRSDNPTLHELESTLLATERRAPRPDSYIRFGKRVFALKRARDNYIRFGKRAFDPHPHSLPCRLSPTDFDLEHCRTLNRGLELDMEVLRDNDKGDE